MCAAVVNPHSVLAARQRRIRRPWRVVFIIYAVALIIATHWPSLTLGPEVPGTDKTIHLAAYGLLTVLLWRAGWFARLWVVAIISTIWGVLDEFSQGLPGLNRTVTPFDTVANTLGVMTAITWIWALGPVGVKNGCNRMRLRVTGHVIDDMCATARPWRAAVAVCGCCAAMLLLVRGVLDTDGRRHAAAIAMLTCASCIILVWFIMWRSHLRRMIALRPCLACSTTSDVHAGTTQCPRCGSEWSSECWSLPAGPQPGLWIKLGMRPLALGVGALVMIFGFIALVPLVYAAMLGSGPGRGSLGGTLAPRLAHWIGTLPLEFTNAIDLAVLLLLLAVLTRIYRRQIAAYFDRADRCVGCGHDVRYTPTDALGVGRCGECGTAFVRVEERTTKPVSVRVEKLKSNDVHTNGD